MEIKTILLEEIEDELNDLAGLDLGSDEYKAGVDGVAKLMDRAIEMEEIERESKDKVDERENENQHRKNQDKLETRDRLIKNCIAVAGIVIPTVVTIWGTNKSLKFEEDGTITTIMGRGFINKLLPKK
jgi:uncharacterized membrane protein